MARVNLYVDESGNFDWTHPPNGTKYFILTSVVIDDSHQIAHDLLALRRELAWDGVEIHQEFHASEDQQAVRDLVFGVIAGHPVRVDATILEKAKAEPQLRVSDDRFYQYAWFYHMRHVAPLVAKKQDEMFIVAASVGTKKKRKAFVRGVEDVAQQTTIAKTYRTACWPAAIDPCLQVADYCSWAIQRLYEANDGRSYDLIKPQVKTMYDLFITGRKRYY